MIDDVEAFWVGQGQIKMFHQCRPEGLPHPVNIPGGKVPIWTTRAVSGITTSN